MPSNKEDFKLIVAAYRGLLTEMRLSNPDLTLSDELQKHALEEAAKDVSNHNAILRMEPRSVDLIKVTSFIGCHLLTFFKDKGEINSLSEALVRTLDGLICAERSDNFILCPNMLIHLRRLVSIEVLAIAENNLDNGVWGHGFWRVGLYVSCLTTTKMFESN